MASGDNKDRFLIALAKFFGLSPRKPNPLAAVQVCNDWFLAELVAPILGDPDVVILNLERFNQLMLACGHLIASKHFFDFFFGKARTVSDFEDAVERFRTKAMWLYGNFRFAYKQLSQCDSQQFEELIARTTLRKDLEKEFRGRSPFLDEIQAIPEGDLGFLGYISSQALDDYAFGLDVLKQLVISWDEREKLLQGLGAAKQKKISEILKEKGSQFPSAGINGVELTDVKAIVETLDPDLQALKDRQASAQQVGMRNTQRYLTLPYLDVYVATSMRTPEDYVTQHAFVMQLFQNENVRDLNLRYFDPTASYDPDRIKKGLIECLMLRRAAITIYNAGAEDTMGKDSELAATLAQGKPVIVYVQSEPAFVDVLGRSKPVSMDQRAKTFNVDHPLGLQICTRTGVAHGIIVVRTVDQCARMLRKVLLHDLSFSIKHEGGNFKLEEKETQSVLRVVTDDPLLSHSFWTYFRHTEPETDI
ncbi:MAG: hypothetical protein ACHP8A_14665 [Terriglobales bacterium]|jgi:hypothetical protein|nr:hypothetical protein [Terriglobales bacterium]